MSSDSASTPSKLMFVVFATRAAPAPLTAVPRHLLQHTLLEPISEPGKPHRLTFERRPNERRRHSQPDETRHVLGARPAISLVSPASEDRREPDTAADPECAGALGRVELVAGKRQKIDTERPHIDRQLSDGLHGIGVEQGPMRMRDVGQSRDGLHRANLVVGVHDGHDRDVVSHDELQRLRRDDAVCLDRQDRARVAAPGQVTARVEHGLVLDGARHNAPPLSAFLRFGRASQGEIV